MDGHPPFDGLRDTDFQRLAGLIEERLGIKMPPAKRTMLEGRLRRRVQALGCSSMAEYCAFLFERLPEELPHLADAVTTNKTDFLREPDHFDYLAQEVVPVLAEGSGAGLRRPLALWSAACSSGQEPYSIAMVLAERERQGVPFDFAIKATDISTDCLRKGSRAVYAEDAVEPIPYPWRTRYLLRARDPARRLVRIVPGLRRRVSFGHLNLLDGRYPWPQPMDVIFCRNVLIYFAPATQMTVLDFLCRHLVPGGYLFLGHSETLTGHSLPVRPVAPAVYRRQ